VVPAVQNGSGGLVVQPALALKAPSPQPVAVRDIDGDGLADVLVLHDSVPVGSSRPAASVGWLRQTGTGFAAEKTFPIDDFAAGYDAKALAVGDIEGDGAADVIAATTSGVSLLIQNADSLPSLGNAWISSSGPSPLATNVASGAAATITLGRDATNV